LATCDRWWSWCHSRANASPRGPNGQSLRTWSPRVPVWLG
jgi:hypothetical protein